LDHFMSDRTKGWKNLPWGKVLESKPMEFAGSNLYAFELKYWRSDCEHFEINNYSYLIMKWKSDSQPLQKVV
jgi:hypothetical protein